MYYFKNRITGELAGPITGDVQIRLTNENDLADWDLVNMDAPNEYDAKIAYGRLRCDSDTDCQNGLIKLVQRTKDIPGALIECGPYKLGMTILMAANANGKPVYAADVFGGLPYGEGQNGFRNFADANLAEIQEVAKAFDIQLIIGKHEDTIPKFPVQPLSFIRMDSDFYSSHKVCLHHLWPMLSPGGIIDFHDYGFSDVTDAIREEIPKEEVGETGFAAKPGSNNEYYIVKKEKNA